MSSSNSDNEDETKIEQRAIAWVHAIFSKRGVFQGDKLREVLSDNVQVGSLYDQFVQITRSSIDQETFRRMARILLESYDAISANILTDNDGLPKFRKRPRHDKWMDMMTFKNMKHIPNAAMLNFTKEPRKRLTNVDLVPQLLRLFDKTPWPYLSVSYGTHRIMPEGPYQVLPRFFVPKNVCLILPKTLALNMGYKHMQSLHKSFMDPRIVKQYCTNPAWATGSENVYDNFRNRVHVPPGTSLYDAYVVFNDKSSRYKTRL